MMTAPLDIRERQRLGRLLGMLGSDHDGEVINAAKLADQMVRKHGLTWEAIIAPTPEPEHIADPRQSDLLHGWPTHWAAAVAYCSTNSDALNERSNAFILQLAGYSRLPSDAQLRWLRNCVEHLMRGGQP
jgi:hypothetical protein